MLLSARSAAKYPKQLLHFNRHHTAEARLPQTLPSTSNSPVLLRAPSIPKDWYCFTEPQGFAIFLFLVFTLHCAPISCGYQSSLLWVLGVFSLKRCSLHLSFKTCRRPEKQNPLRLPHWTSSMLMLVWRENTSPKQDCDLSGWGTTQWKESWGS